MSDAASILKETFGYGTFRPLQKEVIENVLARRDTLAVMPTGGGKSLCYQIPALMFAGLTVVVSPLIALMKDQVEQLHAYGVPSLFLNSTLSAQEYQQNMDYVRRGEVKLLYVAPETLLTPRILSLLFTMTGLALVQVYMKFHSIYQAHAAFTAAISPPIMTTVILGILWRRFSARAAFLTLTLGGTLMALSVKSPGLIAPLAALHGMDPGAGFDFMRAFFGMVLCTAIAVVSSLIWPNRDADRIAGLWVGTLRVAKRLFKGREPNDAVRGAKLRLRLEAGAEERFDEAGLQVTATARVADEDAQRMQAREGDLVYVCDRRIWLGGLHSLHATLVVGGVAPGTIRIHPSQIEAAPLRAGELVVVEKII